MLRLARRYDVRAPRYTSYPTAAQFHGGVGAAGFAAAIARTNDDPVPAPLSLYLHLPFCRSLCYYCACNKIITRNPQRTEPYPGLLADEARLVAPLLGAERRVTQLHLGGGTPTYYSPGELGALIDTLREILPFAPRAGSDWSIEVDPRTVLPEDIRALRERGFTRLSFGVQDLDPDVQKAINRELPTDALEALVAEARAARFSSINFDLIYGLPRQNPEGFSRTLAEVTRLRPDRLALYAYAHLPQRFRAQKLLDAAGLPRGSERLELLLGAIAALTAAGYEYIGMDHFALPGDALARSRSDGTLVRNFQGYVPGPDTDLIGLGASAISSLGGAYVQNAHKVSEWEAAIRAGRPASVRGCVLDADDELRRAVIAAVMCRDTVRFREFEDRFDIDFLRYFDSALTDLDQHERDGLVQRSATQLQITPLGRLFLRAIAMTFDGYLGGQASAGPAAYSRVV